MLDRPNGVLTVASIRAYGAQEAFKAEAYTRIDKYSRAMITHVNLNRYVCTLHNTLIFVTYILSQLGYHPYRYDWDALLD